MQLAQASKARCKTEANVVTTAVSLEATTAVSLEIPGIVVSLEIPVSRIFLVKISGKIVKIGFFGLPGPK